MKTFLSALGAAIFSLILCPQAALAQINDDCGGAENIPEVENFCSPLGAGNTFFASPSPGPKPSCALSTVRDIWFCFTAIATDVSLVINGSSASPGGTLGRPTVALYSGSCPGALTELACAHDNSSDIVELQTGGLTPGEKYYIRVDGSFPGSFQYCIRNFFDKGNLSADCPRALALCDKTGFIVSAVTGSGDDPTEMDDAPCFPGPGSETNSTWFVWTAATAGTLEFTLTPNNPNDDIDFIVYRLPNGPSDCSNKIVERCMAAGDFFATSDCMGPTGLSATATDVSQPAGCLAGEDNFLAALQMQAGETYALAINNFTSSGNGFQFDWGGSAELQGPQVGFVDDNEKDSICVGEYVMFTDTSVFVSGNITGWEWNFGKDAIPATADSVGPHNVQYSSAGIKTVTLTIRTADGCQVTAVAQELKVDNCCALDAAVQLSPGCPGEAGATAHILPINALAPLELAWNSGQTDTLVTGLGAGNYAVTITDAHDCLVLLSFEVTQPLITYTPPKDTTILKGTDAVLSISTNGPNASSEWTGGGLMENGPTITVSPDDTTKYYVATLAGDCSFLDSVTVFVLQELFEMPNAFTPDRDGTNDELLPAARGMEVLEFRVWSRWGDLVFDDPSKGWDGTVDGKDAPSDLYVYRITYQRLNGEQVVQKGDVVLLR
ncbi:MAG: gliding motility-associated C-terminal domain-containing protein [Saprospiraceae bacterium]|nr:gliding motility-associated C-terminal domain-containing protein [Saprospiraceae bacterium]